MSARRTRRLVTVGSLSLALALITPAAALADHRAQHDPQGASSGQGKERPERKAGSGSTGGGSSSPSPEARRSGNKPAADDRPSGGKGSSGRGGQGRAGGGDPRGNNGTIKVDGEAFDDGRGNEPHVGCVFELDFYGFDAGDTATITFTGHAPTGGGLLHRESATLISNDAAGGGQDRDATLRYSVANQLSELLAVTPHPQQGWHVAVAVDVDSAPGGAKQKVFWIDCPQTAPVAGTTTDAAAGSGSTAGTTSTQSVPQAPTSGAGALGVAAALDNRLSIAGRSVAAARGEAATAGAAAGAAAAAAAAPAGAGGISARGAVRPTVLPFTGAQGLVALLVLGLGAVGAGALVHRVGRKGAAGLG